MDAVGGGGGPGIYVLIVGLQPNVRSAFKGYVHVLRGEGLIEVSVPELILGKPFPQQGNDRVQVLLSLWCADPDVAGSFELLYVEQVGRNVVFRNKLDDVINDATD